MLIKDYIIKLRLDEKPCIFCGLPNALGYSTIMYELRPFRQGTIKIGNEPNILPFIVLNCNNCGMLFLISIYASQLIPKIIKPEIDNPVTLGKQQGDKIAN